METKLRMWNPASKSYLYDIDNVFECLKQQHKFDSTMPDRGFVHEFDHRSEGMKWEIFIGKQDKKHNEIYVGDILLHKGAKGTVIYDKSIAMFMIYFNLLRSIYSFDSIEGEVEIIGNINENPELLNN